MLLHALQDDYNLNALADTKRGTESLTFMNFVYMTDPQGNRLTDPQGNYLVGMKNMREGESHEAQIVLLRLQGHCVYVFL